MKLLAASYVLTTAVLLCEAHAANNARGSHVLHEKRSQASSPWIKSARVHKDAILPIRIGLTQSNLENGYDHLMDV